MKGLLQSRKFWLAVAAVVQSIALDLFGVPDAVWLAIDGVIAALLTAIGIEDAGKKAGGG